MKQKTLNLLLGGLALGMVAVVALNKKEEAAKNEIVINHGAPLTTMASNSIDHIAIRYPDAPEIKLEKKDNLWHLTAPIALPADLVQVSDIIALAATEQQGTLNLYEVKRPNLGLEPPRYTVTLNDTVFALGEIETLGFTRYVEVGAGTADDRIARIKDLGSAALDSDYSDLVSKQLLPSAADIAIIEVPGLRVERKGDAWAATPAQADATPEILKAFVEGWSSVRAVTTEIPNDQNLKTRETEFATVTLADGSVAKFQIRVREDQRVLFDRIDPKIRYGMLQHDGDRLLHLPKPVAAGPAEGSAETAPAEAK